MGGFYGPFDEVFALKAEELLGVAQAGGGSGGQDDRGGGACRHFGGKRVLRFAQDDNSIGRGCGGGLLATATASATATANAGVSRLRRQVRRLRSR